MMPSTTKGLKNLVDAYGRKINIKKTKVIDEECHALQAMSTNLEIKENRNNFRIGEGSQCYDACSHSVYITKVYYIDKEHLCSAAKGDYDVPYFNTLGHRHCFSFAAPAKWNALPGALIYNYATTKKPLCNFNAKTVFSKITYIMETAIFSRLSKRP